MVRRPTHWLNAQVDENIPALAPPEELLDDIKSEHEALKDEGLEDANAHNRAMEAVDYEELPAAPDHTRRAGGDRGASSADSPGEVITTIG